MFVQKSEISVAQIMSQLFLVNQKLDEFGIQYYSYHFFCHILQAIQYNLFHEQMTLMS